jgi:KUP system potassium uptake protein
MKMRHTSSSEMGQIYIPFVNWAMLIAVILVVIFFETSSNLASAYGIAVTGTMIVTTIGLSIVMLRKWHWPLFAVISVLGFFLVIESVLLAANITKIATGGWLPLLTALILFTLLTTWFRGQKILSQVLSHARVSVRDFAEDFVKQNYRRVPGVAVYMTPRKHVLPEPMVLNLKYNKVLHERVILLTVQTTNEPFSEPEERYDIQELADDFYRVIIRYGFLDEPNLDRDMRTCLYNDESLFGEDVAFFMGHESVIPTRGTGMAIWREHIYAWMKRNAGSAIDFYRVPAHKVMEIGGQYEI